MIILFIIFEILHEYFYVLLKTRLAIEHEQVTGQKAKKRLGINVI
jgi:hypothetical protein